MAGAVGDRTRELAILSDPVIAEIVRRVTETARPLRILVFGSHARREARADSDLDLLVVVRNGTHRRSTAAGIHRQLCDIALGVDVVVATEDDIARQGDRIGLVYRSALKEGVEVYAA